MGGRLITEGREEGRNLCALVYDIHSFIKLPPTSTDIYPQVQFIEGIGFNVLLVLSMGAETISNSKGGC